MLSSYLYQHLCGYLSLNFQAYYYSSQICRVSWWAACFAQLPVGLPSLSSLLMGCLPSHRANWGATSTFPVKLTDGLPALTSLLMARNKHPLMPKSFTVLVRNSLSMVKSNSDLTKSGRSAFIIPSRPLLKGGSIVLEQHSPTCFNMNEVYALYIFLFYGKKSGTWGKILQKIGICQSWSCQNCPNKSIFHPKYILILCHKFLILLPPP